MFARSLLSSLISRRRPLAVLAAAATLGLPFAAGAEAARPSAEQAPAAAPSQALFQLFVDPPTRFAFIKLPQGWKFVGQIDAQAMQRLPAGTLSRLLPPVDVVAVAEANE